MRLIGGADAPSFDMAHSPVPPPFFYPLGFLVVERFGVAITNEQALCIGTSLIAKNITNSPQLDANYWSLVQIAFDKCLINIDVADFLSK